MLTALIQSICTQVGNWVPIPGYAGIVNEFCTLVVNFLKQFGL